MEDKHVKCACGAEFTITVGEQEFYASKGFPLPKRCKDCRIKKRAEFEKREKQQASPFHPTHWKKGKKTVDEFVEGM